jgi:hypothetical protein
LLIANFSLPFAFFGFVRGSILILTAEGSLLDYQQGWEALAPAGGLLIERQRL